MMGQHFFSDHVQLIFDYDCTMNFNYAHQLSVITNICAAITNICAAITNICAAFTAQS